MKERNMNLPLGIGLLLFGIAGLLSRLIDLPARVYGVMIIAALALEVYGIARWARSEEGRNSPLRRWKIATWHRLTAFARRR